eukprot:Awhi_evm1s15433
MDLCFLDIQLIHAETVADPLPTGLIIGGVVGGVVVLSIFFILMALLGVKLWKA